MKNLCSLFLSLTLAACCTAVETSERLAPVQVLAYELITGPLANMKIILLETNETWTTDANGLFNGNFSVGAQLTFFAPETFLLHATQGATVVVPDEGLSTPFTRVVLQIPSKIAYALLTAVSPGKKDPTKCMGVVTVTAFNKTIFDDPQGLDGATVSVDPPLFDSPLFYFGIVAGKTNPLPNNLVSTSLDGGVMIRNLEVGHSYVVTAHKDGYNFTSCVLQCNTPGQFVNAPPNNGPMANHA